MRSQEEMVDLVRSNWDEGKKELDLSGQLQKYTGEELSLLMAVIIAERPHVLILLLCSNDIGDVGATKIAEALPSLGQLQELNLGANSIGDVGATKIAEVLPSLGQLQELHLGANGIGDVGATRIAEALPSLGQLQELHLDVDPNQVVWRQMGWAMPAEFLAVAKKGVFGFWNWGPMAARTAEKVHETTEWLPPHVRARIRMEQLERDSEEAAKELEVSRAALREGEVREKELQKVLDGLQQWLPPHVRERIRMEQLERDSEEAAKELEVEAVQALTRAQPGAASRAGNSSQSERKMLGASSAAQPKQKAPDNSLEDVRNSVEHYEAVSDYEAQMPHELSLQRGALVEVQRKLKTGWWEGVVHGEGGKKEKGWFPSQIVKTSFKKLPLEPVTKDQSLEAEAVPSLHSDLISTLRKEMERRSDKELEAAVAEFEAAEQRVRTVRNELAEAMEKTKEEELELDAEQTRERDDAVALLVASGAKLLGMRGDEQPAAAQDRLTYLREELISRVEVIRSALSGSSSAPLASTEDPDQILSSFLQTYDGWLVRQQDSAREGRARTEQAMSDLVGSLKSFTDVLEHRQPASSLPPTQEYVGHLARAMAREQSWFAEASGDYTREVQAHALTACTALVDKLKREEHSLVQLLAAFEDAARVIDMGPNARQKLLEQLDELHTKYEEAEEEFDDAKHEMEKLRKKRNASEDAKHSAKAEVAKASSVLSGVRSNIRKAWVSAYTLAAGPYPELPVQMIRQYPSILEGLHSADGGRLFCPCSSLEQYQDLAKLSATGANHNVWTGVVLEDGREVTVVLKEFDLGPTSDGGAMRKRSRTMQREVDTLARLKHPNVIQVQLFFLQEDKNRLLCYVRFQLFPGGDLERWLRTDEGKELSKVQVVLLDTLRGLEHVHYHGIVHCDVKPANVLLTEVQPNGHRRAVLADFDLSLDQQQRRQHMSTMSAASMLTGGPRGTPGLLTLAPEVTAGGQEPTAASDMFSFGGLALLALFAAQAQAWQSMAVAELWDGHGQPRLEAVPPLVSRLLSREPTARPSASEALADDWFAAMGVAEQREAARQVEELVQEQQRFRAEEAALALAAQAQMKELQRQKEAMEAEAESFSEQKKQDVEKKKQDEARLRQQRQALEARGKDLARKEASVVAMIKSRIPPYWQHDGRGVHLEPTDSSMNTRMQDWIRKTVFGGPNHQCGRPMLRCTVTKMLRVENGLLWQQYQTKKEVLKAEHREWKARSLTVSSLRSKTKQPTMPSVELNAELNELFLFHGTSHDTAQTIAHRGFDERVAALSGLYGAGSYFADSSCKSNQYAKGWSTSQGEHILLLCRVTMGWAFATNSQHKKQRRPPDNPSLRNRPFDSIFAESGVGRGGQQKHNEFVVFDRNQVYPEYIIFYKL